MIKHILIATDGSDLAQKAVEHGLTLAKALDAKATILTVTESIESATKSWDVINLARAVEKHPERSFSENFAVATAEAAQAILEPAAQTAKSLGVAARTAHVEDEYPAPGIVRAARERGCDLIVMASHGRRGLSRIVLGSQAAEVVATATVPVTIVR